MARGAVVPFRGTRSRAIARVGLRVANRGYSLAKQMMSRAAVKSIAKGVKRKASSMFSKSKRAKTTSRMDISSHNDMMHHKMKNVKLPGKPFKGKTTTTLQHIENWQGIQRVGQGYQAVNELEYVANHNKLMGSTATDRTGNNTSVFNPWLLDTTASRVNMGTSTVVNNPVQSRMLYDGVKATYEFVNLQNVPLVLELLLCSPRYDTDTTPYECWNGCRVVDGEGYADEVQGQTTYATTTTQPGYAAMNYYGSEPYHHRDWNRQWRILGKKVFVLQPGDQRIYTHHISIKKVMNRNVFLDRDSIFKAGFSIVPLVVAKAGAVGIAATDDADAGQCGHAGVNYGAIVTYHHKYRTLPKSQYQAVIVEEDLTVDQGKKRQSHINDQDAKDVLEEA